MPYADSLVNELFRFMSPHQRGLFTELSHVEQDKLLDLFFTESLDMSMYELAGLKRGNDQIRMLHAAVDRVSPEAPNESLKEALNKAVKEYVYAKGLTRAEKAWEAKRDAAWEKRMRSVPQMASWTGGLSEKMRREQRDRNNYEGAIEVAAFAPRQVIEIVDDDEEEKFPVRPRREVIEIVDDDEEEEDEERPRVVRSRGRKRKVVDDDDDDRLNGGRRSRSKSKSKSKSRSKKRRSSKRKVRCCK